VIDPGTRLGPYEVLDGRFLAVVEEISASPQPATVVVNWTAEASKK
jgi:hypothetical protein